MSSLILSLIAWLGAHGPYALPATPPAVISVSHDELCAVAELEPGCPAAGIYHRTRETIYLRQDLPLTSLIYQAVLLHELVHWAQAHAGPPPIGCEKWALHEAEAYALEAKWLSAQTWRTRTPRNPPALAWCEQQARTRRRE